MRCNQAGRWAQKKRPREEVLSRPWHAPAISWVLTGRLPIQWESFDTTRSGPVSVLVGRISKPNQTIIATLDQNLDSGTCTW